MKYELAKELKDNGFIWEEMYNFSVSRAETLPTLSELIEACGDVQFSLMKLKSDYQSSMATRTDTGRESGGYELSYNEDSEDYDWFWTRTPEEAVAKLWLALNKK